jgi:pimeloyl-ACP methyl ester carboxylesterase
MITRPQMLLACATLALAACSPTTQPAWTVTPRAFTSDQISVTTRGTGPDIVLIHGLAGHPDVWNDVATTLDDRYRLHLVHIRGFGGAPRASTDSLVSAPVAREVARYIREVGITKPAIVGHSMGGTIAMMIAAQHPDLAGRVMVVDMIPFMGAMFGQPNATVESLRPIADQMHAGLLNSDMFSQMLATMVKSDAHRQTLQTQANASDRRTVANAMRELILTDMRTELPRITVPITVLYVQPSNVPMPADQFDAGMRELYARAPNAQLVRVNDSLHFIQLDQPARLLSEIDAFMRR